MQRAGALKYCARSGSRIGARRRQSSGLQDTSKAFVSQHYTVNPKEIRDLVSVMKSEFRTNGSHIEVKQCNLCSKGNRSKLDNLWKLYINPNGSYHCFRCSEGGSWFNLKQRVLGASGSMFAPAENEQGGEEMKPQLPDQQSAFLYTKVLFSVNMLPYAAEVMNYLLDVRQLDKKVLQRYGVGCSIQSFMNDKNEASKFAESPVASDAPVDSSGAFVIERVKHRALSGKGKQRLLPKGGGWGFFGWHLVKPVDSSIIITEGEFDAMAVSQTTSSLSPDHSFHRVPSVSLPNGCNSLPPELVERLERFSKIYLWMDNDISGIASARKFAAKLGLHRCYLVNPPLNLPAGRSEWPKDANDALRQGVDLVTLLEKSYLMRHEKILTFSDLRVQALLSQRDSKQFDGTPTPSVPRLTGILKGFRKGELVVFTGPTGCGKTTLLSQLSIDFAKTGAKTLWGSFEIKNHRLARKMLQQYHSGGGPFLELPREQMEKVADDFETLPLLFMNFHSGTDLSEVLSAMEFAVYRDDVQHIILDNLQFMMPRDASYKGGGSGFQKFESQDYAIDKFRSFATEKDVNIILVIHPKKDDDKNALGISSVFGTAKATQEADAILILQRDETKTYLDVRKNRYDGELGKIKLGFSPITSCFFEL